MTFSSPQSTAQPSILLGAAGLVSTSLSSGVVGEVAQRGVSAQAPGFVDGIATAKNGVGPEGQDVNFAALLQASGPGAGLRIKAEAAPVGTPVASAVAAPENLASGQSAELTLAEPLKAWVAPQATPLAASAASSNGTLRPAQPGNTLPRHGLELPLSEPVPLTRLASPEAQIPARGAKPTLPLAPEPATAGTAIAGAAPPPDRVNLAAPSGLAPSPLQAAPVPVVDPAIASPEAKAAARSADHEAHAPKPGRSTPITSAASSLSDGALADVPLERQTALAAPEDTELQPSLARESAGQSQIEADFAPFQREGYTPTLPLAPGTTASRGADTRAEISTLPKSVDLPETPDGSLSTEKKVAAPDQALLDAEPTLKVPSAPVAVSAVSRGAQARNETEQLASPAKDQRQPSALAGSVSVAGEAQDLARAVSPEPTVSQTGERSLQGAPSSTASAPIVRVNEEGTPRQADSRGDQVPALPARVSDAEQADGKRQETGSSLAQTVTPPQTGVREVAASDQRSPSVDPLGETSRGTQPLSLSGSTSTPPSGPAASGPSAAPLALGVAKGAAPSERLAVASDGLATSTPIETKAAPRAPTRAPLASGEPATRQFKPIKGPKPDSLRVADRSGLAISGEASLLSEGTQTSAGPQSSSSLGAVQSVPASAQATPQPPGPNAAPLASAPAGAANPSPAPAASSASTGPASATIEQFVEQVAEARDAARSTRPELSLRHGEFGTVGLRIDASAGASVSDWRATLTARDPGFVPAVQAALADRAVAASSESALAHNGSSSQRGQDQNASHSGSNSQGSGANLAGSGSGSGSGQEPRYGSSTGGGQGSVKPYSGEETDSGSNPAAADNRDDQTPRAGSAPGGALFA